MLSCSVDVTGVRPRPGATDQPVAGLPNYHLDAVCDTGDWVHVEQRFGASSLASSATPFQATAPPASWADWRLC